MVVCHIFRIEVTMIVYNGLVFSILMIQTLRNRCLEEEILVDKWFHTGCMVLLVFMIMEQLLAGEDKSLLYKTTGVFHMQR